MPPNRQFPCKKNLQTVRPPPNMFAVDVDYVRIQSLAIVRGGLQMFPRIEQMWCGKYLPDAVYALSGKVARRDE